jgi:hypothetical protein
LKFDLSQQKVKINGRTAPEVGLLLTIDDVEKFVDGVALLADRASFSDSSNSRTSLASCATPGNASVYFRKAAAYSLFFFASASSNDATSDDPVGAD